MKILIAYYSKTGNTQRVALDLSTKLGADIEKIIDKKKRSGIWGYLSGGRDAMKKILTEIEPAKNDSAGYDLVILGMPVWGWNLVPAIRTYLTENQNKIKNYAFFVTSGNTDAEKLTKYFSEVMRKEPLALAGFNAPELKDDKVYQEKTRAFVGEIEKLLL
jgi:flavodoxin